MGTFGKTAISGTPADEGLNYVDACPFTLSEAPVYVSKLSMYRTNNSNSSSVDIKGLIYSDNASAPNTLLGASTATTMVAFQSAGWIDLNFATPILLSTAATYWLGWVPSASSSSRYGDSGGTLKYKNSSFASPANPFGTPDGTVSETVSIYATYAVVVDGANLGRDRLRGKTRLLPV